MFMRLNFIKLYSNKAFVNCCVKAKYVYFFACSKPFGATN